MENTIHLFLLSPQKYKLLRIFQYYNGDFLRLTLCMND